MSPGCLAGRHAGKRIGLVNWSSTQMFAAPTKRFQCFSTTAKKDRFKYSKRSLSSLPPALWQVATHAPKGILTKNLSRNPLLEAQHLTSATV